MSGAGAVLRDTVQRNMLEETTEAAAGRGSALRQEAAERLQAHRLRRGARHAASETVTPARRSGKRAGVAAAVAERYAHSPSYRAVLADEARRAIERAEAEAAVAARNAEAVAVVQGELLAELEMWNAPQTFTPHNAEVLTTETLATESPAGSGPLALGAPPAAEAAAPQRTLPQPTLAHLATAQRTGDVVAGERAWEPAPVAERSTAGITVKLYEDLPHTPVNMHQVRRSAAAPGELQMDEAEALEDEIAFRQAPVFEDFRASGPVEPLAANLLEFPRQLVAPKKARPRHAEGPLREEMMDDWQPRGSQLRIFEVGAKLAAPEPEPISTVPEWSSIWLEAHVATAPDATQSHETAILPSLLPPQTAPVSQRIMAAAVDCILVAAAVVGFVALSCYCANSFPTGANAALSIAAVSAVLYVAYHLLFFSLSGQTPGMRYARIGLCTFTDENPSRAAMRKRVLAMLVAASPLGLGILWVWLDDDRLGWHDRMSRMYQRAY